jgi:hypothetical protein
VSVSSISRTPPRQITPRKSDSKPSSPTKLGLRTRLASFARSVEGPSPLAQIFQPLVVQEAEEHPDHVAPVVSYGPAHRRRLSSMQSVQKSTEVPGSHVPSTSLRKFPAMRSASSLLDETLSERSDRQQSDRERGMDEDTNDFGELMARLEKMEQGQKRIEELLLRLSN